MNKTHFRWFLLVVISLLTILVIPGESLSVRAQSSSPTERIQDAWQNTLNAGSYRFISDIKQTFIPRSVPEMIGQQESILTLASDGAVVLPDQSYLKMQVLDGQRKQGVAILRNGNQSFMLQDGEIKPVENSLNLASQSNDLLGYLSAADQVTLLEPPENHPELVRYGFVIDGPRYAEYVRQRAESALKAQPGAPQELTTKPIPALQKLSGQGELWVNQAGFPVREVVDVQIPQVNDQYNAKIHMLVDFSSYGKVESLPKVVQGSDGKWQLQGTLPAGSSTSLGDFPGFGEPLSQAAVNQPASSTTIESWWSHLTSLLPIRVSPTAVILFLLAILAVAFIRYYRRNPKRCYAIVVFTLIPIMTFSPVLESAGVVRFMERQAQAAEASAKAFPDLLKGLGFSNQDVEAAAVDQNVVKAEGDLPDSDPTPVPEDTQPDTNSSELPAPDSVTLQENAANSLQRCGDVTTDIDTDSDGLKDAVELCLGTNPNLADTDQDGITDKTEVEGFEYPVASGKIWTSDPNNPDTNGDGIADLMEWATKITINGQEVTTLGRASHPDLDQDKIPNIWDDDDDADGVPDAQDISPFAVTGYTTRADLSTQGGDFNGYETVEIQVQPENPDHLRYSTTALDWPNYDNDGNIQDLDESTEDLRLIPFLIVTTNVAPDQTLAEKYGFHSFQNDDQTYTLMVPLVAVQNNGAIHSYYAKIVYAPGQTADIQWQAQMVWLATIESDTRVGFGTIVTEARTLHEYPDSFRLTGMKVTKDTGYEAAVFGTPYQVDDLYQFRLILALNDTYKSYLKMVGQNEGETALQAVTRRFSDKNATVFNVPASEVVVTGPQSYGHMDAGLAGIGSELIPGLLENELYKRFYENNRCKDADGNSVNCASLLIAYESKKGTLDLLDLPSTVSGVIDLSRLHINLAAIPLLTTRGVQMNVYEQAAGSWQMTTAARMLELMEQRYKDNYATAMRTLYPSLGVEDVRFITYSAYLWATSPSYNMISVDGQVLVGEVPDEAELINSWTLKPEEDAIATSAVNWYGVGSGIAAAVVLAISSSIGAAGLYNKDNALAFAIYASSKGWDVKISGVNAVGAGLFAVSMAASLIMGIINALCPAGSDLHMCQHEKALKAANIVVKSLALATQTYKMVLFIYKFAMDTAMKWKFPSVYAGAAAIVGAVVGIAMTWVSFGVMFAANGGMGNPAMANALFNAIVMTIYIAVMCVITFIPFIGQVIAAVMAVLDAIFYLFTWLFGGEGMTVIQAFMKLFYDSQLCVDLGKDSEGNPVMSYGEYTTSLGNEDMGLVGGNTLVVSAPFEAPLQETAYGNADDLANSFVQGTLSDDYLYYKPEELAAIFSGTEMSDPADCNPEAPISYCSNAAKIGFLLTPKINGIMPVQPIVKYTLVWAAFALQKYRWKTDTMEGIMPEDADILKPSFMYLDVLPDNITDLWNWSSLTNHDPDGDGLTNDLETLRGTSTTKWDTDGDGLSDNFEVQNNTNPVQYDSDYDGLNDGLELRLGTNPNTIDSDSDGLKDGQEVRHYNTSTEALVGGWQVTIGGVSYWVSSDPAWKDKDADELTDAEEKSNNLSPHAQNQLVPVLSLEVKPLNGIPGERIGAYWQPNQNVEIKIILANGSPDPVTTNLSLSLPDFLTNVQVGEIVGDHNPTRSTNGNLLSWSFSSGSELHTYESVTIPITATTNTTSGSGVIELSLPFGSITLDKVVSVVMDNDNPEVGLLAPTDGAYLRGTSYVVGGTATDPTTWVTKTELSIVSQGSSANFQDLNTTSSPWAYSWDMPTTDGVFTLQAQAADFMGHVSTTAPVNVTVDNTPPAVTLASEMVGGTVHLSGTATDNLAGIAWVRLSLDGQPWRSVSLDGANWSYDWTVGEGAQGEHEATVMAIDRSGNKSNIETQTITVDSVAPSNTVNGGADVANPPIVQPGASFDITGVANEGGHLPQPATPIDLRTGMDVFEDSAQWLGLASIHDNDGGVLAAWIGDFNADRLADLAVGLPGPDGDAGRVAVLYGRAGGWSTPPDLEMLGTSPMRFTGVSGARLGSYLAAAGDANGDNFSDLLVGERDSTRAFLIFGNPRPLGEITLEGGHSGYRSLLQAPANIEGMASAGDVNADGFSDLLIQAGGTAYLILGRSNPWPETIDLSAEAVATFNTVTGALGVGDVDDDQLAEWVTLKNGSITLYGWNLAAGLAEIASTKSTADSDPRAVALGDVDGDGKADWIYSNGTGRILVYGNGSNYTFTGYDGFFVAPGDVDGDGYADILLTTAGGVASLVKGGTLSVLATVNGVGGAANALYTTGADLNSDGSDDLLLIPSAEAAATHGFDAPNFSSGFISPQSLPLGASTTFQGERSTLTSGNVMRSQAYSSSTGTDTFYVDDDKLRNNCEGHSPCYETIQEAVTISDGGGDIIIVYPGTYGAFNVPADSKNNKLTINGVSADAVFIDGKGTENAITVAADDVHLSNLTVRNANNGILLQDGAGEVPVGSGNETSIDHLLSHSVQKSIAMSGGSALSLSDSTLVGNGSNAPLYVDPGVSSINSWNTDKAVTLPTGVNGALVRAGSALYALPGGNSSDIYSATPGANGALSDWTYKFGLKQSLPLNMNSLTSYQGKNLLAGTNTALWQLYSSFVFPAYGNLANGSIRAVAVHPTTGDIYVGGDFTTIGGVEAFHIARWNSASSSWMRVGAISNSGENGVDGPVYALTFVPVYVTCGTNGYCFNHYDLYIGGDFDHYGNLQDAGNIVAWDGTGWHVMGQPGWYASRNRPNNGVNGPVNTIAYDQYSYDIFIGGSFTLGFNGGIEIGLSNLARYEFTWSNLWINPGNVNGTVKSLAFSGGNWHDGYLYLGGAFTTAGGVAATRVARWDYINGSNRWSALGAGLADTIMDMAIDNQGYLNVVTTSTNGISEWNGTSWTFLGPSSYNFNTITVDTQGNVYIAGIDSYMYIQRGGTGNFVRIGTSMPFGLGSWSYTVRDLATKDGQLYAVSEGYSYDYGRTYGGLEHWAPGNFYKVLLSGGSWTQQPYPPTSTLQVPIEALVDDQNGNLYATWRTDTGSVLYYYNGTAWVQKASPNASLVLKYLVWAGGDLYAAGHTGNIPGSWSFIKYDPDTNSWTSLANPPISMGAATAGLSWSWDGTDHIYLLRGDVTSEYSRYSISANSWESLPATPMVWQAPTAQVADGSGNYYAIWGSYSTGVLYYFDGTTWTQKSNPSAALALKQLVWAGGKLYAVGETTSRECRFTSYNPGTNTWTEPNSCPDSGIFDLALSWDGANHIYTTRWATMSIRRYNISGNYWDSINIPAEMSQSPKSVVADTSGNLYAIWSSYTDGVLYYYNTVTNSWSKKTYPGTSYNVVHLAWANGKLYAVSQKGNEDFWHILRYNPITSTWDELLDRFLGIGVSLGGLYWPWNNSDYIYMIRDDGVGLFGRYSISTNTWMSLEPPNQRGMARIGSYLYVYGTPSAGVTTNLSRYGSLPASDLRLAVDRTAFVIPNTATSFAWTNLAARTGSQFFQTDIDISNAWVAPSGVSVSPALPSGATQLTWAQADFAAPEDGLYRLGPDSILAAGYHHYKGVAHVFTSQAACSECTSGSLTWGVDAFATIRQAVESGAARVLVHAGRYPQTFYLVSGVEVIGAGAENTIIEPPAGPAATLVTAEGTAGASLARLTLAGTSGWNGFLAEGGAKGLKLARMIIRDLSTGISLKGGSEVEVVNNTLVRNGKGLEADGNNPVNVRNTIFAYHTGTALAHGTTPTSLSNTYNDFWSNATDMNPSEVSLGSLFVDPRLRSLVGNDLRLGTNSPLINMGAPSDPTVPGGGGRVDPGYAEYNAAGFYVSQGYSEFSLNDGLVWGVDAFDAIQPALNAASSAMSGLQGAIPEGGYSVGVDAGTYTENVTVPSHIRLVGSGAEVTTIVARNTGSVVTFDGVINSELAGFTLNNASLNAAGVELKGSASGIIISRNVIRSNTSHGILLTGSSSAEVSFNTILNNSGAGVYANGAGSWANMSGNLLDGNTTGLQAQNGALVRNSYNLLHNIINLNGVTAGDGTIFTAPVFIANSYYVPSADSDTIDAADPLAAVPLAGGLRADLGYKELVASPLTLFLGPEIASTVTANSGVAKLEIGIVAIADTTQPAIETLPTTWETLTPAQSDQPLYYWTHSENQTASGLYRVYTKATDAAGNSEANEFDWYEGSFVVDDIAPTLSWVQPIPASTNAAAVLAAVNVSGTVNTGSGERSDVAQISFSVTGPSGTVNYPAEDGQAWIPLPNNGSYTISATAVDEAGNQASLTTSLTVNATTSVATVTHYAVNSDASSTQVALSGYVRFIGSGTGTVEVKVNGGTPLLATLASPGSPFSAWSSVVTLPANTSIQSVVVTPKLNGTPGNDTTLDKTPPSLVVTSPATGTVVRESLTFSGTASDSGSGMARVEISLDGGYAWSQAAISGSTWSLAWSPEPGQDYVTYPAQIRAVDADGNLALVERPVTVDNLPPSGLAPVSFGQPVGQHLEKGSLLTVDWNAPVDGSGSAQVFMDVNQSLPEVQGTETVPSTIRTGTSATATLDTAGEWYVHIMTQDGAGNQYLTHFGPWYVSDTGTATPFGNRRKSILIDGFIDLEHSEWKASELLGEDARSGHNQELYATWDSQSVYLGWSGAWWTLQGVLWAYLDTIEGAGATTTIDGSALPIGLAADRAVEINSTSEASLWSWSGSAWVEGTLDPLDFANGPTGDTEVRVSWSPSPSQKLNLVAYAQPRQAEEVQVVQMAASVEGEATLQQEPVTDPWAVFPTTNALLELDHGFAWTNIGSVSNVNSSQPTAPTIYMNVSSSQASEKAYGTANELDYSIALTNPQTTDIPGLTLRLQATNGLSYLSQTGATCASCTYNTRDWTLTVGTLAAGEQKTIDVIARADSVLTGIQKVTSTFTLAAGTTVFTPESQLTASISHRIDGQAPTVSINALGGSAIASGSWTFSGTADDGAADGGPGSGVATVQVSLNGGPWTLATGSQAWSISLPVSGSSVTLQARAKDFAGLTSTVVSHTFYVDNLPPNITWTLPTLITSSLPNVMGSVQDQGPSGSRVRSVEVQLTKSSGISTWYSGWYPALIPSGTQSGLQNWTWAWITCDDNVPYQVRVRATDEVGNTTTTAWQPTTVDNQAPRITITQQATLVMLPGPATLLAGTVEEKSKLYSFDIQVYGPQGFYTVVKFTPGNLVNWTYAPDLSTWKAGTYKLRVTARDVNNNSRMLGPFVLIAKDTSITNLTASNDGPRRVNEVITFTASIATGSNVTYTWDFGDGSKGSGKVVTHAYTQMAYYTVQVIASNPINTLTAKTVVNVGPPMQTGPLFTVNSTAGTNDHRCDVDSCTLREAIEAANNDNLDSTIELSNSTYTLSETDNFDNADNSANLLPPISTNIIINGHGAHLIRASTAPSARFFDSWGQLTLNEVWLQGGKVGLAAMQAGGAILNYGTLIVKNSYLDNNEASGGGAIYNGGTLYLYNSTIWNNISTYGAVSGHGSFYLYSNTFLNNIGTTTSVIHLNSVWSSAWGFYNNLFATSVATGPLCNLGAYNIPMSGNLATDSSCTGFGTTTIAALKLTRGYPASEGGLTPSVSINTGSSLIDKGNNTYCQLAALEGRDQRNYKRTVDGNGDGVAVCDVGSFEYGSTVKPPAGEEDTTPPQVRIVLTPTDPDGSNGWYRSPVTVTPQFRDTGSEVIGLRCALDPQVEPASYDELPDELCPFVGGASIETDGVHNFYLAAMDEYGNQSEVAKASFQIDASPPLIACPAVGPFLLGSGEQAIGPAEVDASVSGMDEAAANILTGSITTESIGPRLLTFLAFDLAGNLASQECSYNVGYDFGGFYPPLEPAPALNPVNAGKAISLKFSLAGDQGLEILAEGYPTSQQVDPETLELVGEPSPADTTGKRELSYDAETSWYNYIWKTDKAWAGTARVFTLQLTDGTQHLVYFNFQ